MIKEISAGAIIFRKNKEIKYLFLKYKKYWGLVKGNVEKKESIKQTAVRETKEETSIQDLKFIPNFQEKISYFYKKENKFIYKEVNFLLAKTNTKKIKLSFEHEAYKWLNYKDSLEILKFENLKNILKKVDKIIKKFNNT